MSLPIQTPRLVLRRFREEDYHDLIELVSHPTVAKAIPEISPTEQSAKKYLAIQGAYRPFQLDKCFDLAIERRSDGKLIGILSTVSGAGQQAEIGYALAIDHQGQGYATEAARGLITYGFSVLEWRRVFASTSQNNANSWRVMERLGMRRKIYPAQKNRKQGEEKVIYAIRKEEWHKEE